MARIAAHHKPGHPLQKDGDYVLQQAWPDDCYVQWGGGGVVFSKEGNYRTAFFEAFPGDNSGGFIRGEGATIADAEAAAFKRWQTEVGCVHVWGRRGYTNGGAFCTKCKAFKTVFEPIVELGAWKARLSTTELVMIRDGMLRRCLWSDRDDDPQSRKVKRRIALRAVRAGIKLPPEPAPQQEPSWDDDEYSLACAAAVFDYYAEERKRLFDDAGSLKPGLEAFFKSFELAGLEREFQKRQGAGQ